MAKCKTEGLHSGFTMSLVFCVWGNQPSISHYEVPPGTFGTGSTGICPCTVHIRSIIIFKHVSCKQCHHNSHFYRRHHHRGNHCDNSHQYRQYADSDQPHNHEKHT
ncbi:hypothetical protein LDENG_00139240 [Lucifuga dentata]|nr:hypothetical protein LDENG_00139240 [Lucifuga dentata]